MWIYVDWWLYMLNAYMLIVGDYICWMHICWLLVIIYVECIYVVVGDDVCNVHICCWYFSFMLLVMNMLVNIYMLSAYKLLLMIIYVECIYVVVGEYIYVECIYVVVGELYMLNTYMLVMKSFTCYWCCFVGESMYWDYVGVDL